MPVLPPKPAPQVQAWVVWMIYSPYQDDGPVCKPDGSPVWLPYPQRAIAERVAAALTTARGEEYIVQPYKSSVNPNE